MSDRPEDAPNPSMAELLDLPDDDRSLVLWIQRQHPCPLDRIQAFLQQNRATTLAHLKRLEAQGYLEVLPNTDRNPTYHVRLRSMRQRRQRTLDWVLEERLGDLADEPLP